MKINEDQYQSILLNKDQCRSTLIHIEKYWSVLIFIDGHWYLLIGIGVNATNLIRHWWVLIAIDHWYSMPWIRQSGFRVTTPLVKTLTQIHHASDQTILWKNLGHLKASSPKTHLMFMSHKHRCDIWCIRHQELALSHVLTRISFVHSHFCMQSAPDHLIVVGTVIHHYIPITEN